MLRNARHNKILELIEEQEIETQEELCKALMAADFNVTQATVSRDVRELRLFKVAGIRKRYRYAAVTKTQEGISEKMCMLFQACLQSIETVGNVLIIKTLNGNGANAGVVIDRLDFNEIAGTVAGDDTVISVCRSPEDAEAVKDRLLRIAKG